MKITTRSGHLITISEGNSKMGKVYSFSVTPIITCKGDVPCKKECYACKLCRIYKNVAESYNSNLNALKSATTDDIINTIADYINNKKIALFRFNVSGDFKVDNYFDIACKIADKCQNTKFLAFTKLHELATIKRPENFNLVLSAWGDYLPNKSQADKCGVAYFDNGEYYIPADALECSGNCEKCELCFNLKSGYSVKFKKH